MKNKILPYILSLLIVFSVEFTVNADQTNGAVISNSFENADYDVNFSREDPYGDLNSDGVLNGNDLIILQRHLLNWEGSFVSQYDINKDSKINILDLVRLKKAVAGFVEQYVQDGEANSRVLVIGGKVTYTADLISLLEPNTLYQISYRYKTDNGECLTISLNGTGNTKTIYQSGTERSWKYHHHLLKTGNSITANKGNELQISGNGRIDDFVITKVSNYWYDGDLSEQGGYDKFLNN